MTKLRTRHARRRQINAIAYWLVIALVPLGALAFVAALYLMWQRG